MGQTATITYSVRVADTTADGAVLQNLVVSDPTLVALTLDGQPGSAQAATTTLVNRLAMTGTGTWNFGIADALLLMLLATCCGGADPAGLNWTEHPSRRPGETRGGGWGAMPEAPRGKRTPPPIETARCS